MDLVNGVDLKSITNLHNLALIQVKFEKLSYRLFLCFAQVPLQLYCITFTCDNWVYFSIICKEIQAKSDDICSWKSVEDH